MDTGTAVKGTFWHIRNEQQLSNLIDELKDKEFGEYGYQVQMSTGQRTTKQNSALHKYFELLAEDLNSRGLDQRKVLKENVAIEWNKDSVKKYLWSPIQQAVIGETSTTKLERDQVDLVYVTLAKHLGEKFGVMVDFPSAR
jgi:hypothetical protein